jgi:hypothetical protein
MTSYPPRQWKRNKITGFVSPAEYCLWKLHKDAKKLFYAMAFRTRNDNSIPLHPVAPNNHKQYTISKTFAFFYLSPNTRNSPSITLSC